MNPTQRPPVIVLGLTATGLAVARDLAPAGWRVIGVDADRTRPGAYSRHVQLVPGLSRLALGPALADAVAALAAASSAPPILVAAEDAAVAWCIDTRAMLARHVRCSAVLAPDQAGQMLDKAIFAERCRAVGIDVPHTVVPTTAAAIDAFVATAGLPCLIKPRLGHLWRSRLGGDKLLVANDLTHLHALMATHVGDPDGVVLQALLPGPEAQLVVAAVLTGQAGGVRAVVTGRKIRQYPKDFGSGSVVRTEQLPELAALAADVAERLDLRGLHGLEFKQDPTTGRLLLLEVNARPTLWFDLCRAAGAHLVRAHVQELAGLPVEPIAPARPGVVWRYLVRDAAALAGRGPLRLAEGLASVRPAVDAVLAWDDPGAGLASFAHAAWQAVEHARWR